MIEYSVPGFKMSFPKNFKCVSNFPHLYFTSPKPALGELQIKLLHKNADFEDEAKLRLDPSHIWATSSGNEQIIKLGDYHTFRGAKCRFVQIEDKSPRVNLNITLFWEILVPIKSRIIRINGDSLLEKNNTGQKIKSPETYQTMADIWLPVIDSIEFDAEIIANFPDVIEAAKSGRQIQYHRQGLKFSYPEKMLTQKGTIYDLYLKRPAPFFSELVLTLHPRNSFFGVMYMAKSHVQRSPDYRNNPEFQFIRGGYFTKFEGAGERLYVEASSHGFFWYTWQLSIPVGNRFIEIMVRLLGSDDISDIDNLWRPIVESLEFDPDIISALPDTKAATIFSYSWKKTTDGQSQHVRIKFGSIEHFLGLYAVKDKLFTNAEADDGFEVTVDLIEQKWAKKNKRLLLNLNSDPIEGWSVDFYLNTEPPDESDPAWGQIIEGFINFSNGKLFANSSYEPAGIEIVLPKKGIYKFRVYFAGKELLKSLDMDVDEEDLWQIYLWPTDETIESNEIKVIKAFER